MLRSRCSVGVLASALLLGVPPLALAANGQPNVVFILADNVGYGDLNPYGGGELRGAPTPRIDQLAHEGLKLPVDEAAPFERLAQSLAVRGPVGEEALLVALDQRFAQTGIVHIG